MPEGVRINNATPGREIEDLEAHGHHRECNQDRGLGCECGSIGFWSRRESLHEGQGCGKGVHQPQRIVCESNCDVENHVVRVIESWQNG